MSMSTSGAGRAALAETLLPEGAMRVLGAVLLVVAGTVVLAISAKIKVPFWPVPITLQTLAIMAIAAAYGSRLAVATVLLYLAEGAVGLPVFTNTPPLVAGPAYFLGPTGGFLIGFVFLAAIVGWAADRGWSRSFVKLFAAMLVADVIVFALGFVLGTVRLGLLIPRFGETVSTMIELPVILAGCWIICGAILKRAPDIQTIGQCAAMGVSAFALLMVAELILSTTLVGRSLAEHFARYTTLAGALGLAGQLAFALFPLARRRGSGHP